MIIDLLGHPDYLRIVLALARKPLRFTEIQRTLGLNPAQVDRALSFLRRGLWIIATTVPSDKGPVRVVYSLGKRGEAFLEAFGAFQNGVKRREDSLGRAAVAELMSLSR